MNKSEIKNLIRVIPDYPKPGIIFQDLSPLYKSQDALNTIVSSIVEEFEDGEFTKVVGVESRGYILGVLVANRLNIPFVQARKAGKTPVFHFSADYHKEYGKDSLEIAFDDIVPDDKVLIVDDVLATGGTANAAADCCNQAGVSKIECAFIASIKELSKVCKIKYPYYSLLDL